ELSLVHELGGRALVRALLVPQIWRLRQTLHSRIFTQKSLPDIIKVVLEDGGLTPDEYAFRLSGKYEPEEHVCQYHESDFDFICRRRSLPASIKLKDYDYSKPTLGVSASAPVSRTGLGEISLHGSRFFTPDAGKRLAEIRAEEMLSREVVFTGSGTALYLRAG